MRKCTLSYSEDILENENRLLSPQFEIHHYNTIASFTSDMQTSYTSFSNRSVQLWNAISSKTNMKVLFYIFKYYVSYFGGKMN